MSSKRQPEPGRVFVRRRGTTPIPNATVHDDRLSYAALGLLAVILARPSSAPQGYRDLMGRGLGQEATLKALRELSEAGYRHQVRRVGPRGRFVMDTVVSEDPITPEEASDWLEGGALWKTPTARRNPTHGPTSRNAPSSQVPPRGGSPQPGGPRHGQEPHVSNETQGDIRTSSYVTGDTKRACMHGRRVGDACRLCPAEPECPHGVSPHDPCALCRRGTRPRWDQQS